MNNVTTHIKENKYQLVWIELPSNGRALPPNKRAPTIRQICMWIRQSSQSKVTALLVSLRGKHWNDESIAALVNDKITHEASYHLCAFNIKVTDDSPKPSAVVMHAHATFPISPKRCRHNKSEEHVYELKETPKVQGRAEQWLKAKAKLYDSLLGNVWHATIKLLGSIPD